ncbi:MAG TPA: aminotransferase class I/II-fold pyridoxal phosphate-dependent enzyme [Candidatus Eisenbacteria bacterium]
MTAKPRGSIKAARFTESVIREMTRLAQLHGALNLAQGFPDFPAPAALKEAAIQAIRDDVNQYAITWGAKSCREAIARKFARYGGFPIDPEREITVTCGATEAMIATLLAVVDPGDEVIVFEPFYENYGPDAILSGAVPRFVKLRAPDWTFDPAELAAAFNDRTRAIIINTPNNPTGKVFDAAEMETIAALCRRHDVLAVTDEIYEHILYDGAEHVVMASLEGMRERTVTINALSKTYSVTGWRVGYIIAPPDLTAAIRKTHDFLTVGAPAPLQAAAATALDLPDSYYEELRKGYHQRRDILYDALGTAGLKANRPRGAYYIMADFGGVGFDGDDTAFAHHLIREIGVAPVPGSSFFNDPKDGATIIRFCFPKQHATLTAAGERLQRLTR